MSEYQIRNFTLHPDGRCSAELVAGGSRATVDDRYGSWQATVNGSRRTVRSDIAAQLAIRARRERKRAA